jgi:hypothetical protein
MIIIARSYGQLGNRLFLYAHMIAAARAHGVSLANPCFADYAHLFPATCGDLWCRYPRVAPTGAPPSLRKRRALAKSLYVSARCLGALGLNRSPLSIVRLRGDESCDLASDSFADLAQRSRHLMALGWLFRSETLLAQHADAVRHHFQISSRHNDNVREAISTLRQRADFVVGVHIRHGDYATYLDGKYFFTTQQYAAAMRRIAQQLPDQRVAFLVCSNSSLNRRDFGELDVQFGPGHIIEDMYCFAETDLLIGPPSTYTGWASFFGKVPLVAMHQADTPIDLSQPIAAAAA